MTRFLRRRLCLLLFPVLAGCAERDEQATQLPMSQGTYVDVMAELTRLRRLPPPARGEPERERLADSIRAEILLRHGVTAEQLVAFADVAGRDPTLMMGLSQAIAERADSVQAEIARGDSTAAAETGASGDSAATRRGESRPVEASVDTALSGADGASSPPSSIEDPSEEDSVPGPRFAEPSDSSVRDPSPDSARPSLGPPARRRFERPARLRKPD